MGHPTPRFTLRQLPLPAKLVLTVFLIAVGLGYFSALVQLHLNHSSRAGEPMPTVADVIERFSGVKKFVPGDVPKSKIETVLSGPRDEAFGKRNMTPAFFEKSGSDYGKECKARGKDVVDAEREGERLALIAWCNTADGDRKKAYDDDKFAVPAELADRPITPDFFDKEAKTVPVKTLIEVRCLKCHAGDKKPDLDDYPKLAPLATPPRPEVLDGKWVRSGRQMTVEALTQSTHAHLLSFAVLFALTGLTFAFSGYPGWFRGVVAPVVLLAQVLDVSCWWLARLDGVGPAFAMAIVGTGTVVGLGLAAQIVLSLFDLYGWRGKFLLVLLFLAAGGGFAVLGTQVILPALKAEKDATEKANQPEPAKAEAAADKPKDADKNDKKEAEEKKPADKPIPMADD